jgi:hypothetical protein
MSAGGWLFAADNTCAIAWSCCPSAGACFENVIRWCRKYCDAVDVGSASAASAKPARAMQMLQMCDAADGAAGAGHMNGQHGPAGAHCSAALLSCQRLCCCAHLFVTHILCLPEEYTLRKAMLPHPMQESMACLHCTAWQLPLVPCRSQPPEVPGAIIIQQLATHSDPEVRLGELLAVTMHVVTSTPGQPHKATAMQQQHSTWQLLWPAVPCCLYPDTCVTEATQRATSSFMVGSPWPVGGTSNCLQHSSCGVLLALASINLGWSRVYHPHDKVPAAANRHRAEDGDGPPLGLFTPHNHEAGDRPLMSLAAQQIHTAWPAAACPLVCDWRWLHCAAAAHMPASCPP